MLRRAITGHKGLLVLAVFFRILMASTSEIKIQVNSPEPRENQTVILSVTGITERILFSEWYQGKEINADNQIIRYNTDGSINQGKKYFTRAQIHSNGSLVINNVTKDLEGDYTVYIQGITKANQQTAFLKVIVMAVPGIIKIQVNPPKSLEFQTVILSVTGIKEGIYYSEWFQGNEMLDLNQILRHNNKDGSQYQGNRYFSKAEIQSNGSLVIKNVTKDLQGNYTVHVQGDKKAYQDTVYLKVTDTSGSSVSTSFADTSGSSVSTSFADTSGSSAKASASICLGISSVIVAAVAGVVYL